MKRYDVLLLDADGTVLDFPAAEKKALHRACSEMGLNLTPEREAKYTSINVELWRAFEKGEVTQEALRVLRFERFLQWLNIDGDATAYAEQFVSALSLQPDMLEGACAFMKAAAARVPIIIVTNGIASVQRSRFALSPLHPYVSGYIISAEVGCAKPDPRMIEHALEMAQVPAERALMVGDEPRSDIAAANAAGVDSCWYNPNKRDNTTTATPTYEVDRLEDILQWL